LVSTWPKAKLNPMNEPKVPMYSSAMIQVCGSRQAARMAPRSLRTCAMLSMNRAAQAAAMTTSGM
jgi:hypothetical protein